MNTKKTLFGSVLVLYFVIAFEVLIMISPFAGFFYAVFNPVLLKLAAYPATRWLSAFFLPHMVLPSDGFLVVIRVVGSILFVLGTAFFAICASQIYAAKFRKRGAVVGGLYSYIRHPQYVSLATAGLGLAILWPRILTVVLWVVMLFVYYLLAKDEERRMLKSDGDAYGSLIEKTGMFLPKPAEDAVSPSSKSGKIVAAVGFAAVVLCGTFLLRAYTIRHLTLWTSSDNVAAVAILPEDSMKMEHRMEDILGLDGVRQRLEPNKRYLAYFLPKNYIMQGMIADTGGDWKLFEQHRTVGMILDWIINPFGHLRGGHHGMHEAMHNADSGMNEGVVRRIIFLSIEGEQNKSSFDLFAINAMRVPQFMADVDVHNLRLLAVKDLPHGSGWGTVPTPAF